jgi:TolB protein
LQSVDVGTGRARTVLTLDGGLPVVDAAHRMFTLRVSPDLAHYLAGARDDRGRSALWLGRLHQTGPATRLTTTGDEADFPVWSRDGRRLAYQATRGARSTLAVQTVGGTNARVLVDDATQVWVNDWSPDGRYVVAAALRDARWRLEAIDTTTGKVSTLTPTGVPSGYVRWPVWSPDGTRIVFERGSWSGNIWVAQLPPT